MINRLVDFSLRYRYFVLAVYVCLGLWGYVALRQTSIDALPDLSDHQVIVFTDWPGHSAQEVEDQVTYPLTVNLQGLTGVRVVRSQSAFGFSMIYAVFEDATDLYFARARVLERLSLVGKLAAGRRGADAGSGRDRRRPHLLVHGRKPVAIAAGTAQRCRTGSSAISSTRCRASPKSRRSAASSGSTRST